MEEISGPVVGIALVLSAVFIPTASFPVSTDGVSAIRVTIAISVILSAFNALTLSPALAALLLRPRTRAEDFLKRLFDGLTAALPVPQMLMFRACGVLIRKSAFALILLVVFGVAAGFFGSRIPSSFPAG